MTPTQRGYYIQLLAEAWDTSEPGFLPAGVDIWWLAGASSEEEFRSSSEIVMSQFKRDNHGRFFSERLVAERNKQVAFREMCSQAGKKSRNARLQEQRDISVKVGSTSSVEPARMQIANSKLQIANSTRYTEKFEQFWKLYPRTNGSKSEAFKAWRKAHLDNGTFAAAMEALAKYIDCPKWKDGYIKHAATWINQRMWEVEPDMTERGNNGETKFNLD